MSEPQTSEQGYCIGCGLPSGSWACADCRASLDQVVTMLHAPRGEVVATWLSIMTTDARLERGQQPAPLRTVSPPPDVSPPSGAGSSADVSLSPAAFSFFGATPSSSAGSSAASLTSAAPPISLAPTSASQGNGTAPLPADMLPPDAPLPDRENDRLAALGLVIEQSAILERRIQAAFCALAASEFAVTIASRQSADWLINTCEALTEAHRELPDAARMSVKAALLSCREAIVLRNDLVHGVQSADPATDDGPKPIATLNCVSQLAAAVPWTTTGLRAACEDLRRADLGLATALQQALRPERPIFGAEAETEADRETETETETAPELGAESVAEVATEVGAETDAEADAEVGADSQL